MSTSDILIAGGRLFFNEDGHDGAVGKGYLDLGNLPALAIQSNVAEIEHYGFNAVTRTRQKDLNIVTDLSFSLSFTVDEMFAEQWKLLLLSSAIAAQVYAGASIVDEVATAPILLNRSIFTAQRNISSLVVDDQLLSASPFVLGTDYTIPDPVTGEIFIIDGGGITTGMSLYLTYTAAAETRQKLIPGADASVKGSARLELTAQNGSDITAIIQHCEVKPDGDSAISSTEASEVSVVMNILADKVVTPAEPFGDWRHG